MERTRRAIKRRVQKPIPSKNAARFITIWVVGSKHFRRYILEELITKLLTYAVFSITRRRDYTGAHIYIYVHKRTTCLYSAPGTNHLYKFDRKIRRPRWVYRFRVHDGRIARTGPTFKGRLAELLYLL